MRGLRKFIFFLLLFNSAVFPAQSQAVSDSTASTTFIRTLDINPRTFRANDSIWIYSGICKTLKIVKHKYDGDKSASAFSLEKPRSFLKISGNVQYDFLYRSFADTPYYQKDFRQHTIHSSLSILVKDKYPLRFNFMIRKSNSPYFKNFFDGGLQFDKFGYDRNLKQQLATRIERRLLNRPDLTGAEDSLQKQLEKYTLLKRELKSPDIAQHIIEEREKIAFGRSGNDQKPSTGSLTSDLTNKVAARTAQLDSMEKNMSALHSRIDSIKNAMQGEIAKIRQKIFKAAGTQELKEIATENGIKEEKPDKFETFLSNIKSIGIGRSVVNYSELTASNVALTGINIEYNPRIYAAVAAGKIDYGFRDFFGRNTRSAGQHLLMGRLGWGDKDKRAIIFSLYTGKKQTYGGVIADSTTGAYNVTGYSVEALIKKDQNTEFSIEVAKSTRPVTGTYRNNKELNSLFRFADQTNIGVSIKGQTIIPETKTRFTGSFRKTGENFQSFSLFTYNTDQTAWILKADQPFYKDRINLTTMLRRNDFVNPFTVKTFKTTTVFTSVQLAVRIPHWPSLSAGYYPGSQLYIIDKERVRENVYYILNGTLVHNYKLLGIRMTTSAIYNNYVTKGTDSGFINYSGTTYMLSHSLLLKDLQLQGNLTYTDQQELRYLTLEGNADYSLNNFLRLGAGVKYNKIDNGATYWGGTGQLMIEIKKLGALQLQYEKSFLPTIYQTLFPVEIGRVSWFKYF